MDYDKTNILVTGGLGFIGSNFVNMFNKEIDYHITILDKCTYAGTISNLDLRWPGSVRIIVDDIINSNLDHVFDRYYDAIFHFAAESHVDNSINDPGVFIETNVKGTYNLLEYWRKNNKRNNFNGRFIHVSTDEVYGHLLPDGKPFTENTPIAPRSPYSASKASSDLLVQAYHETYGLNTIITRCCNNFGPRQHNEKLIPKTITNILQGKRVPIYGNGKNVREWIHVSDHVEAIRDLYYNGKSGEIYNIGSGNELSNIKILDTICRLMNRSIEDVIEYVDDRPGHDFRYAINSSKIRKELSWQPKINIHEFEKSLQETIDWYTSTEKS